MTQPYGQQPAFPEYPQHGGMPPEQAPMGKPGTITAAAVLGYVQAGITLIPTILLFAGLVAVSGQAGGEVVLGWLIVLAQLAGCVLLIFGGVKLMAGTTRTPYVVAVVLELVICVYYLISIVVSDDAGLEFAKDMKAAAMVFPVVFAIMPVIGLVMVLGGTGAQWLAARSGRRY